MKSPIISYARGSNVRLIDLEMTSGHTYPMINYLSRWY